MLRDYVFDFGDKVCTNVKAIEAEVYKNRLIANVYFQKNRCYSLSIEFDSEEDYPHIECDILNTLERVVEVRSSLRVVDMQKFLEALKQNTRIV